MKLIRIESRCYGIRYITPDIKYRIQKLYKKACWELSEITGNGHKIIAYYKYFKDAKKHLKNILEG